MEVMGAFIGDASSRTEAIMQGRRTWNVMADAWPSRSNDDDPFTEWMNTVPKYVVTDTLGEDDVARWSPTTIIRLADLVRDVTTLREREGGDVNIMGSVTLVRALLTHDLVDEVDLMIEPIMLGGGKRIFPDDGVARRFRLDSMAEANTGVLCCRYLRD
jgi:dihydrofolate reductase